ncbi:MAG: HAD-IA family hydrolase [Deltaproteobacteria bacterium]|nr:HAD-IA family hydrolase [Deltaproteobacteria bacterium]
MTHERQRFSVWLVPAASNRAWAEETIRRLAADFEVVPFAPHVTIYSGPYTDEKYLASLRQILSEVAATTEPVTLKVKSLDVSDKFFRSLFVSFEENPTLRHIHQRLQDANPLDNGHELTPHLSLLYADIPLEEKKKAAGKVFLDREMMRFNGIRIVLSDPLEGWANIKGWNTVFSARLDTPAEDIKAVLFDFGGVLAEEGFRNGLCELARRQGLDPQYVAEMGRNIVHQSGYLIGQGTEKDFWQLMRLQANLKGSDRELSDTILDHFVLRPDMIDFVRRLRARGFITVIVSDQTDWLERLDRRDNFYQEFDHVFNSYRLGKSKRDPSLFEEVARDLGIKSKEAIFTDDTADHVARAESRGMLGIVFDHEDLVRKEIEMLLAL